MLEGNLPNESIDMWYDLVILAILVYASLRGAARGLVWQLAWIVALILCFAFAESVSIALAPHIKVEPPLNRWIAMFVLYVGFSFASFGVARMLRGWIEKAKFVEFDRHLGGIFGFLKGVVFSLVLTFFVVTLSERMRATVLNSYSGFAAGTIMEHLHPVMPKELHSVLEPYIHTLDPGDSPIRRRHGHEQLADDDESLDLDDLLLPFGNEDGEQDDGRRPEPGEGLDGRDGGIEELLGDLPGLVTRELKDQVTDALSNMGQDDRDALMDRLRDAASPDGIREMLKVWEDSAPDSPTGIAASGDSAEQQELLQKISAVYEDGAEAQRAIIDEIESKLAGLPDQVATAVLADWHADLMSVAPDPDPGTSFSTRLDSRILRQVESAGIPLTRLSSQLQRRLKDARQ